MRLLSLPILSLVLAATAMPAVAQVTVDLHALEALPEHHAPAPRRPSHRESVVRITPRATRTARTEPVTPPGQPVATPAAPPEPHPAASPAAPAGPPPALPQAPPQIASIPAIAPPPPPMGAAAPPPPPVSATAGTVATATNQGLSLTFAPGKSDLTPQSVQQIKQLTGDVTLRDTTTYNVAAYAPGTQDDPSSARRLSLSRALAVRQALVADGIPSPRIFVRALGATYGTSSADHVDIDVQGAAPQAASK